ncbi:T9SS type A sorting domain-containing protein [Cryomorphaceae bacterium 1068]|nr:T9SS type A sorting domain-containing protein [Cryomorphaceae bacterium 1068]
MKNPLFYITTGFAIILAFSVQGQVNSWSVSLTSQGEGSESINKMETDDSGNIFISGSYSGSENVMIGDVLLEPQGSLFLDSFFGKLSPSGEPQWIHPLGDPGTVFLAVRDFTVDDEGFSYVLIFVVPFVADLPLSFEFAGLTLNHLPGAGDTSILVKINQDGNGIWSKTLTGDASSVANANLTLLSDGNILVSGNFIGEAQFDEISLFSDGGAGLDLFAAKLDVNDDFVWANRFGSVELDQFVVAEPADDGGYFMSGYWSGEEFSIGGLTVTNDNPVIGGNFDRWIAKLDLDGVGEWLVREASLGDEAEAVLKTTSDGGVMAVSYAYDPIEIGDQSFETGAIAASKYDDGGNLAFVKELIAPEVGANSELLFLEGDGDTFFLSTSFASNTIEIGGEVFENQGGESGSYDGLLLEIDSEGDVTDGFSYGGDDQDYFTPAVLLPSGDLLISGAFSSSEITLGETTLVNSGEFTSDFFIANLSLPLGLFESSFNRSNLLIYPNPAVDNIQISGQLQNGTPALVRIYTLEGRLIDEIVRTAKPNNLIDVSHLQTGAYLIEWVQGNDQFVGKFLKN